MHAAAFAYVTNSVDNTLSVIDTSTRAVVATIPIGPYVHRPFLHPDGYTAYVHSDGTDVNVKVLSVIDATTNGISRRFELPFGTFAVGVHPDGKRFFVIQGGCPGALQLRDLETLDLSAVLPVGCNPAALAVTPDATRAYVRNISDLDPRHPCFFDPLTCELDVSVLDLIAERALEPIRNVGSSLTGIAADPLGRTVYVGALARVPQVGVRWALAELDLDAMRVSRYLPLTVGSPGPIVVAPTGAPLYVLGGGNLQIFDPSTGSTLWDINLSGIVDMALTPDGSMLYLPVFREDPTQDGVLLFDIATRSIVDRIHVGRAPVQVVIGPDVPITPVPTPAGSATPTAIPTLPPFTDCTADCNTDGEVTIDELLTAVAIVLGSRPTNACLAADCHHSACAGQGHDTSVDCVVRGVDAALSGCPDQHCASDEDCNDFNPCTHENCAAALCKYECVCE